MKIVAGKNKNKNDWFEITNIKAQAILVFYLLFVLNGIIIVKCCLQVFPKL